MKGPPRLNLRGDVGASVLRAARRESAPASARLRASAAVATVITMAATPSAASVLGITATRVLVMKVIASAGAVVVVAGAVVVATAPPKAPTHALAASPPAQPAPHPSRDSTGPIATSRLLTEHAAPIASAVRVLDPALAPASSADASRVDTAAPAAPSTPKAEALPARAPLADEVAALARAQQALEGGRPLDALRFVDGFYLDFPRPHLAPEADALRIEALAASGDGAGARSFLARFRSAYPGSPLLEHLESVVAR